MNVYCQNSTQDLCAEILTSDSMTYSQQKELFLSIKHRRKKADPVCTLSLLDYALQNNDTAFFKKEMKMLIRNFGYKLDNYSVYSGFYVDITTGKLSKWFEKTHKKEYSRWKSRNVNEYIASQKIEALFQSDQSLMRLSSELYPLLNAESERVFLEELINNEYELIFQNFLSLCSILNELPTNFNSGYLGGNIANLIIDHSISNKLLINKRMELILPYWQISYDKGEIDDYIFWLYDEASIQFFGYQCYNTHDNFPKAPCDSCPQTNLH